MNKFRNQISFLSLFVFFNSSAAMPVTEQHPSTEQQQNSNVSSENQKPSMLQSLYSQTAAGLEALKNKARSVFVDSEQVQQPKDITPAKASLVVQQIIDKMPHGGIVDEYWKKNSTVLLRCAKVLYEESQQQILKTLQEIDKRLIYWQYQKEHQWQYFFSKNPLKWMMGKSQDVEIENNIEQLEHTQEELYTQLGVLSAVDLHDYLRAFNNYNASYVWIEQLLNLLSGTKESATPLADRGNYSAIVKQLSQELNKISGLSQVILSKLADTAMPYHITRNWAKYAALLSGGYYAYNNPVVATYISPEAVTGYKESAEDYWKKELLPPVKNILNKVFFRSVTSEEKESIEASLKKSLEKLASREEVDKIMQAEKVGNLVPLQEFFNNMKKSGWRLLFKEDVSQVGALLAELKLYHAIDTFSVVRNVALLTPAYIAGLAGYRGYQRLTTYDYRPIRRALVDISSLFVDQTKPLEDSEYGKMVYLLHNLKEKAKKELPIKDNVRNDFVKDLERVESREFDAAAKRRIIKDMFKKYTFLGVVR